MTPKSMQQEIESLKEQVTQLRIEADFNFEQYQDAGRLLCDLKEVTDHQAEAIRLKDDLIESQAASIEHYKSGLTSAIQDIEKYRDLCDQMATVMTNAVEHRWPYLDDMRSLIEAERAMR